MPLLSSLPLGRRIPDSVHAVSVSLPTLHDVIGYEEKDPRVLAALQSGYPRFVVHTYIERLQDQARRELDLGGMRLRLTASERAAAAVARQLGPSSGTRIGDYRGLPYVAFPDVPEIADAARLFLQHTGCSLSSRQAEDFLAADGSIPPPPATPAPDDPAATVVEVLQRAYGARRSESVLLANSGMNAAYAAFRAIARLQKARGRTVWVQLGWLYLDTSCILQKFAGDPEDYLFWNDVADLGGLKELLSQHAGRIAGIVTEVPTNPLIQTVDLPALADLARTHGAMLVIDPTLASPFNIDILPFADVAVNSLTKFAGSEGDVILGAAIVNEEAPDSDELLAGIAAEIEPPYVRDLARLAAQIADYEPLIRRVNAATPLLVEYLQARPEVRRVRWSLQEGSRSNYLKVARSPEAVGAVITIELNVPLAPFYDALPLAKGPSFGMKQTLLCPFMYLAHYDLVSTRNGRRRLQDLGLDPDLIRFCAGAEDPGDLIEAFCVAWK